jgi:hypothetical protein
LKSIFCAKRINLWYPAHETHVHKTGKSEIDDFINRPTPYKQESYDEDETHQKVTKVEGIFHLDEMGPKLDDNLKGDKRHMAAEAIAADDINLELENYDNRGISHNRTWMDENLISKSFAGAQKRQLGKKDSHFDTQE